MFHKLSKFHCDIILVLEYLHSNNDANADELSGQLEGDMVLNYEQWSAFNARSHSFKTGLINIKYRWPNNTVPYEISDDFGIILELNLYNILFIIKK